MLLATGKTSFAIIVVVYIENASNSTSRTMSQDNPFELLKEYASTITC